MSAAKVELGRRLFYDERLSGDLNFSCASCHRQELAFTDGRARSLGSTGELHPRSAMSLANVAYSATLTWADPKLTRLEDQARIPMFNREPVELGLADPGGRWIERLRADPGYRSRFADAFPEDPDPITLTKVTRAIASFERTLISGRAPYDRLVYDGDMEALTASARRGMRLFFSERLNCSRCHGGFTFSGPIVFEGADPPAATFHNTGLYNIAGTGDYPEEDTGLHAVTGRRRHMGRFRAPTLRNIELTAPYMHDGSIATLRGVIEHYAQGGRTIDDGPYAGAGRESRRRSELITGFEIDRRGVDDLIAFLNSLTDSGFVTDLRFANPFPLPGVANPSPTPVAGTQRFSAISRLAE